MSGSRTTEIGNVVARLVAGATPTESMVAVLSDLDRDGMSSLRRDWVTIPAECRAEVLERAVELAAERIDFDFTRLGLVALGDPSVAVRMLAPLALGENGGREVAETLAARLVAETDPDAMAATAAAAAPYVLDFEVGHLDARAGRLLVDALRGCLEGGVPSNLTRARLLQAVAPVTEAWVSEQIRDAYYSDDRELQLAAVSAMGQTADDAWLEFLDEHMQSDDPEFRRRAAEAAGVIASEDAVEMLAPLLDDDDPEVVAAALMAFAEIGGPDAVAYLEEFEDRVPEELQDLLKDAAESARTGIVIMRPPGVA